MKLIDLRSDTVTKPNEGMLKAMISSPVGDDVYGEDPTVIRLEKMMSELAGMEAAIFAPSGTQSNLLALMSHCQRGDEYIVGRTAHTYHWEGGGAGVLGSIWPCPLDQSADGTLPLSLINESIKPIDDHHARTKLLCLENTISGKVLPLNYLKEAQQFCQIKGLKNHLDGARVFNAVVDLKVKLQDISQNFDSISICLSKGLGAPIGSVLCGKKDFILDAKRWRKVLGGGMRQVGLLAGAGIYALQHNIERLAEDHLNAQNLANALSSLDEITLVPNSLHTNMFFIEIKKQYSELQAYLKSKGILFPRLPNQKGQIRLVTHLDIDKLSVNYVVEQVKEFYK